ncbi:MAG: Omp28-related outer membrane protein [Bacteroidia bacterium]
MKNQNFISLFAIIVFTIILQSCDKIEPPYTDGSFTPPPSSGNSNDVINLQNIKGTASDFKVTDNWVSDSSALHAKWTVTPNGSSGADGSITFTWHGVETVLNVSSTSGIITFSGPVSITAGGLYGTLSFTYNGTFTSDGSGEGYVAAYVVNEQNILIEDYTGHLCGNCPAAAFAIADIKELYKERVISMGVHAGGYAYVVTNPPIPDYSYNFKTPVSEELDDHFGISNVGNPNGMVNRTKYNNNIIAPWPSWAGHVSDIILQDKFPNAGIKIENIYTAFDSTLKIKVKTCFLNDVTGAYKLCVFLTEDSVQKTQKKYPPLTPLDDADYWHRDVLRGSANGTWGDILAPATKGATTENNYSIIVKNEYRAAYCKVLVFIYESTTEEIIQVQEAPIIQ